MSCCLPAPEHAAPKGAAEPALSPPPPSAGLSGLIHIPGGRFAMGGAGPMVLPGDGEGPIRDVNVAPFAISPTTVTIAEFLGFILDTGYVTSAEARGSSMVFAGHLSDTTLASAEPVQGPHWWREVKGASWTAPEGPDSGIQGRLDDPVVHISHSDALAYCAWAGARLPSEAEWEFAARGGLDGKLYPWGDLLTPEGTHLSNLWQGQFPLHDKGLDGYSGRAPVRSYPPNGYGLYQMTGNVWEWCQAANGEHPLRGGSHLCHASYCSRYRVSSRQCAGSETTTSHIGFRIAL